MVYPPASFSINNINNIATLYNTAYTKVVVINHQCLEGQNTNEVSLWTLIHSLDAFNNAEVPLRIKDYKLKGVLYTSLIFSVL